MRLNKYLSLCGIASRRKADNFIKNGRVKINDVTVSQMGMHIDPEKDKVVVNGRPCKLSSTYTYIALNKPREYVCSRAVFKKEKSVYDLLPKKFGNLKIAGRLDKNSQGLLILSDDGDLIYRLTHPKFEHKKEYEIETDRSLGPKKIKTLEKGIKLEEGIARFDKITKIEERRYRIIMHQGWKRQIRRMFEEVDRKIRFLRRTKEGKFFLKKIPLGKYMQIKAKDIL